MVAELVETSRLWGRTAARIDPRWIEPRAGHLVKRQYSEPHWERRRASVRRGPSGVTLYWLPIVEERRIAYGRIDPVVARELFIRSALVEGDWGHAARVLPPQPRAARGGRRVGGARPAADIVVSDAALYYFYDERIPADVVSGAHFDSG